MSLSSTRGPPDKLLWRLANVRFEFINKNRKLRIFKLTYDNRRLHQDRRHFCSQENASQKRNESSWRHNALHFWYVVFIISVSRLRHLELFKVDWRAQDFVHCVWLKTATMAENMPLPRWFGFTCKHAVYSPTWTFSPARESTSASKLVSDHILHATWSATSEIEARFERYWVVNIKWRGIATKHEVLSAHKIVCLFLLLILMLAESRSCVTTTTPAADHAWFEPAINGSSPNGSDLKALPQVTRTNDFSEIVGHSNPRISHCQTPAIAVKFWYGLIMPTEWNKRQRVKHILVSASDPWNVWKPSSGLLGKEFYQKFWLHRLVAPWWCPCCRDCLCL